MGYIKKVYKYSSFHFFFSSLTLQILSKNKLKGLRVGVRGVRRISLCFEKSESGNCLELKNSISFVKYRKNLFRAKGGVCQDIHVGNISF